MRSWRISLAAFALLVCAGVARAQNRCVSCHAGAEVAQDIHRDSGFSCTDCHGGDRSATDRLKAHDTAKGFRGALTGQAVVAACARCHSDAELMRKYAPRQRVDQATEYATSVHGKRLAAGDTNVATCASCHGAHGIRRVNDATSPVYPTNVANTCGTCHASASHMAGYTLPNSTRPLPTDQLPLYRQSVHYAALTKGNDLSAPTCNDCHGNHGAAPPGAGSVVNVCGSCHAVFAQKFSTSVHAQIFDRACVECHGNHAVQKPSDTMLGSDPKSLCSTCHSGGDDKGAIAAAQMRGDIDRLTGALGRSGAAVASLANAGMEMSAQELAVGNARTKLTLARTEMHTFEPARVTPVINDGLTTLKDVDKATDAASAELRFRRRGLAISLGAILLLVIALGLKIRQLERRPYKHLIQ